MEHSTEKFKELLFNINLERLESFVFSVMLILTFFEKLTQQTGVRG